MLELISLHDMLIRAKVRSSFVFILCCAAQHLATPYIISEMDSYHVCCLILISNMVWIHLWFVGRSVQVVALLPACCITTSNYYNIVF